MNNFIHNTQIELVINQLNQQSKLNISEIVRKFKLVKNTLQKRYRGKTVFKHKINSKYK